MHTPLILILTLNVGCSGDDTPPTPALIQLDDGRCQVSAPISEALPCPPFEVRQLLRTASGCAEVGPWACGDTAYTCDGDGRTPVDCPPVLEAGPEGTHIDQHAIYGCTLTQPGEAPAPLLCPPVLQRPVPQGVTFQPVGGLLCEAQERTRCPSQMPCTPSPPQTVICPPEYR